MRSDRIFSIAIVCGAICGLLDAAVLYWNFLGSRGWYDYLPPSIWFSSPAVFIALLVVCVLPAFVVPRRLRGAAAAVILTLAGPGMLLLVRVAIPLRLLTPRVSYFAWAVATLVVVAPFAWLAARHAAALFAPRWTRGIAIAIVAAIAVAAAVDAIPHRAPVRANDRSKPNVLLVFLDTMRFDSSGMRRGDEALAPSLAKFATQSAVFESAWAPTSWTLPSHLSVVTGLAEPQLGVTYDQQTYSGNRATLAQILRRSGYSTSAILANGFLNPGTGFERGFESFDYASREVGVCRTALATMIHTVSPEWARMCRPLAATVTRRAIRAIDTVPRPFFVALNYMDVHAPYDVPPECREPAYKRFRPIDQYPILDRVNRFGEPVPPDTGQLMRTNYAIAMRCLDRSLGQLFAAVDALPDAKNTYVIVLGDHGEQFGEHELVLHSNSVYRQVLNVPLAIRGPHVAPARIADPVSITSLYGTILNLTRTPAATFPSLLGNTHAPVLSMYRVPHRVLNIPARLSVNAASLVAGRYHYIRWANGQRALFDVVSDPTEAHNIATNADVSVSEHALDGMLNAAMSGAKTETSEGRRRLFSLGYIQ